MWSGVFVCVCVCVCVWWRVRVLGGCSCDRWVVWRVLFGVWPESVVCTWRFLIWFVPVFFKFNVPDFVRGAAEELSHRRSYSGHTSFFFGGTWMVLIGAVTQRVFWGGFVEVFSIWRRSLFVADMFVFTGV